MLRKTRRLVVLMPRLKMASMRPQRNAAENAPRVRDAHSRRSGFNEAAA